MAAKQKSKPAEVPVASGEVMPVVGKGKREVWTPTETEKATAMTMAAVGVTREQIAMFFGVTRDCLRRELGEELNRAEVQAVAKVASTLYRRATEGNDLGAAIFYLKARGGWRETPQVEINGASGISIHVHL